MNHLSRRLGTLFSPEAEAIRLKLRHLKVALPLRHLLSSPLKGAQLQPEAFSLWRHKQKRISIVFCWRICGAVSL
jgi:hypothetical protein